MEINHCALKQYDKWLSLGAFLEEQQEREDRCLDFQGGMETQRRLVLNLVMPRPRQEDPVDEAIEQDPVSIKSKGLGYSSGGEQAWVQTAVP